MTRLLFAAVAACFLADAALAQDRTSIGYGRLITNDAIGDGGDRWQTGSVASSRVWGPEWTGDLPTGFGQMLELRLGASVISPADLLSPSPLDRPYAAALSAGVHTHFATKFADVSMGADFVVTGPVTKLDELQGALHDLLGVSQPSDAVVDAQIGNGLHPTFVIEAGHDLSISDSVTLRPFIEARVGIETYARAGFDLTFGSAGQGEFLVRDPVSGHRYRVIGADWTGVSFVIGADVAHVDSSVFLPQDRGFAPEQTRKRVRVGVHSQNKNGFGGFYGLTYLGEDFEGQPVGQLIGSVRLQVRF